MTTDNNQQRVYLASPGFNVEEKVLLKRYEDAIEACNYKLFSPFRDQAIVDFRVEANRRKIFDSNAKAIEECDWMVVNLDFTTIAGKYPIPIPDSGTLFEVGMAHGLRRRLELSGNPINSIAPNIIAVTSEQAWGINIMLQYGTQSFISGVDRFFEALAKHQTLEVFLDRYDNPAKKDFVIY
jgi:hypothetical protein